MGLDFNDTRLVAGVAGCRELILAVREASPEDEHDWLEWKSALDLQRKAGIGELARQILGLANRDPDAAGHHCEGWGYVLVGVEPGALYGVEPPDMAYLEDALRRYTGDEPVFQVTYVPVEGVDVVVVEVRPPQWGDPTCYLEKPVTGHEGNTSHESGAVFVRRNGATHRASVAEQKRLDQRMRRTQGTVRVTVEPAEGEPAEVRAVDATEEAVERWVGEQVHSLLLPLLAQEQTQQQDAWLREFQGDSFFDANGAYKWDAVLGFGTSSRVAAVARGPSTPDTKEPVWFEDREPGAYRAEVKGWAARARETAAAQVRSEALRSGSCRVDLALTNVTERNFEDVEVEVHLPAGVSAYETEHELDSPGLPDKPRLWGTRPPPPPFDKVSVRGCPPSDVAAVRPLRPGIRITNNPGPTVTFSPVHLRPQKTLRLPAFHVLVVSSLAGQTLAATWSATARDADRHVEGLLHIGVEDKPLRATELLTAS